MNKFVCCTALLGLGLLITAPAAKAQAAFDFESIDTLLEDNRLTDADKLQLQLFVGMQKKKL